MKSTKNKIKDIMKKVETFICIMEIIIRLLRYILSL